MSNEATVQKELSGTAKRLARRKRLDLEQMKSWRGQLNRPDFLWHYLLQSFATMGGAAGAKGLIDNKHNYEKVGYDLLARLWPDARAIQVEQTCREARLRWPAAKTRYILGCFEKVESLGGPKVAKRKLLKLTGREAKIHFLKSFPGIGDKYARNIMMDVYHEDFRDSVAIDSRIQELSNAWGLSFDSYSEHEGFYLSVASVAGLNGWELDRLMFNFKSEFLPKVR